MTFRDDHDAALARAAALEAELERVKNQREALADKNQQLESELAKRPKPPESPKPPKPARRWRLTPDQLDGLKVLGIVAALGATIAFFTLASDCGDDDRKAWETRSAARKAYAARWEALVEFEPCVRDQAHGEQYVHRNTPARFDPRAGYAESVFTTRIGRCESAKVLSQSLETPPAVRSGIAAWLAIEDALEGPAKALRDYYDHRDWVEDNFTKAPALWQPVLSLLERRRRVIAQLRRDVFPVLTAEMTDKLARHERDKGRDETYWRVALALQLRAINDRSFEAAGLYDGRDPDAHKAAIALQPQMTKFLATLEQAPIELRRIIRRISWVTEPIANGETPLGETPLWQLSTIDHELIGRGYGGDHIPALPPDPGPPPGSTFE